MKFLLCCSTFLLVVLGTNSLEADSVYKIADNHAQYLTSTSLKWQPFDSNNQHLKNAVNAFFDKPSKKKVFICRAQVNGLQVSGQFQDDFHCRIPFFDQVLYEQVFDVLVNVNGRSGLKWKSKNKYNIIASDAIICDKSLDSYYVARNEFFVGNFFPGENFGVFRFADGQQVDKSDQSELLVELKPVHYEFIKVKYQRASAKHIWTDITKRITLKNLEDDFSLVEDFVEFHFDHIINWGTTHDLYEGIPFNFTLKQRNINSFWGTTVSFKETLSKHVTKLLPGQSAVNVTLTGKHVISESPYYAKLLTTFQENTFTEGLVMNTKVEHRIAHILVEFDDVFFLQNFSLVPEEFLNPTTERITTTTLPEDTTAFVELLNEDKEEQTRNSFEEEVEVFKEVNEEQTEKFNNLVEEEFPEALLVQKERNVANSFIGSSYFHLFSLVVLYLFF